VIVHFKRQARQFGAHAIRKIDFEHAAAGIELRILKQVARLGHRRKRYINAVEQFGKLGKPVPGDNGSDHLAQHRPRADAVFVGPVRGILQQVVALEVLAEAPPVAVVVSPTKICSPSAVVNGS